MPFLERYIFYKPNLFRSDFGILELNNLKQKTEIYED